MFSKDTQFADWLSWFTSESDEGRNQIGQVFYLPNGWMVATDSRFAVVETNADVFNSTTGTKEMSEKEKRISPKILEMLDDKPVVNEATFTREEFLQLIGPPKHPEWIVCPNCQGKKEKQHTCDCELCDVSVEDCEDCNADGKCEESPEATLASVWNVPFDKNRAAYIVEHSPPQEKYTIKVTGNLKESKGLIHIVTEQWHAIIAQMDKRTIETHDCPEIINVTAPVARVAPVAPVA